MAIERFTKDKFENALITWKFECLGLRQGQYVYYIDIKSPHCGLMLFSSIDASGRARDNAKDSIRAVMVKRNGDNFEMIGGKVCHYVTRQKNWAINTNKMLRQMVSLARWIQPCPECGKTLRLAVKKADKEVFLFCPEDSEKRNDKNHERHLALHIIDFHTGELIKKAYDEEVVVDEEKGEEVVCPVCGGPVKPMIGRMAGKGYNCAKSSWDGRNKKMIHPCGDAAVIWVDKK